MTEWKGYERSKRNDASQTGDIGWIRWERCSGMLLKSGLLLLCLALPLMHGCTRVAVTPEAEETIFNWTQARDYQAQEGMNWLVSITLWLWQRQERRKPSKPCSENWTL